MVRDASDGCLPPVNANDSLHDPDIGLGTLEYASLLDVQLQVGGETIGTALGMADGIRIATESANPVAHTPAAAVHEVQGSR